MKQTIKRWFQIYGLHDKETEKGFHLNMTCSKRYFEKEIEPLFLQKFYTNQRQKILTKLRT